VAYSFPCFYVDDVSKGTTTVVRKAVTKWVESYKVCGSFPWRGFKNMRHILYFVQETPNEALVSIANFMFQVRARSLHVREALDRSNTSRLVLMLLAGVWRQVSHAARRHKYD
jgi:hypothetical protein